MPCGARVKSDEKLKIIGFESRPSMQSVWRFRHDVSVPEQPEFAARRGVPSILSELRYLTFRMEPDNLRGATATTTPITTLDSAEALTGYHRPNLQRWRFRGSTPGALFPARVFTDAT
jgi:hypothetical protein